MKKILFLIPNLKHGGAEKVLVNLANNLDRSKYDVTVQTLFDVGVNKESLLPHVRYKTVFKKEFRGNNRFFQLFSPKYLWDRFVKERYDIAVSYLEGPTSRILSGCDDPHTKRIAWLHIELNTPKLAALGFRNVGEAQKAYRSFDEVVAVSRNVRDCFLQNLQIQRPIRVLYNTNETEQIVERAAQLPQTPAFAPDGEIAVCSVAKLTKTKGFDRLLNVHKRFARRFGRQPIPACPYIRYTTDNA